jgi:hypothetical protein
LAAASSPLTRSGWRPSRLSPPGRGGVGAGRRRHRAPSPARAGARVASPRRGEGGVGLVGGGIEPPHPLGLAPESPLPAGERGELGWSAASRPLTRSGWRPSRLSPPGRGGSWAGRRRHRAPSPARAGARVASPRRGEGGVGLVGGIEAPHPLGLAPESPLPAGERGELGWSAASRPLTRSGWRPSRLSPPGRGGVGAGRRRHRAPSPARAGARVASPRRGEGEAGLVGGGIEPPRLLGLAPESPLPAGERGEAGLGCIDIQGFTSGSMSDS